MLSNQKVRALQRQIQQASSWEEAPNSRINIIELFMQVCGCTTYFAMHINHIL